MQTLYRAENVRVTIDTMILYAFCMDLARATTSNHNIYKGNKIYPLHIMVTRMVNRWLPLTLSIGLHTFF